MTTLLQLLEAADHSELEFGDDADGLADGSITLNLSGENSVRVDEFVNLEGARFDSGGLDGVLQSIDTVRSYIYSDEDGIFLAVALECTMTTKDNRGKIDMLKDQPLSLWISQEPGAPLALIDAYGGAVELDRYQVQPILDRFEISAEIQPQN